jgi:hypothetical protein
MISNQQSIQGLKIRICRAAVDLNNKGVLLLDACNYGGAAVSFKKASQLMLRVVSHRFPVSLSDATIVEDVPSGQSLSGDDEIVNSLKRSKQSQDYESEKEEKTPTLSPTHAAASASTSRKRMRTMSTCGISNSHVVGRPLWMRKVSYEMQQNGSYAITQSAIILYNLGLTFHLNATHGANNEWMFQRALELYAMAKQLILSSPAATAFESPVFLVALHNMMQVYHEIGNRAFADSCSGELTKVLRLLRSSNVVSEDHYEEFYLKLLSYAKASSLAPAA